MAESCLEETIITAYIQPILEYALPIWSPLLKKRTEPIEKVQQRATNPVPETRKLSYMVRFPAMNLSMLEEKRKREDVITI